MSRIGADGAVRDLCDELDKTHWAKKNERRIALLARVLGVIGPEIAVRSDSRLTRIADRLLSICDTLMAGGGVGHEVARLGEIAAELRTIAGDSRDQADRG